MKTVYYSAHKPDCTSIKNQLRKQGFHVQILREPNNSQWLVQVPVDEFSRASVVVWGDLLLPNS